MKYNSNERIDVSGPYGNRIGYIETNGQIARAYYYGRQVAWYDMGCNATYSFDFAGPRKGDLLEHYIMKEYEKENPNW